MKVTGVITEYNPFHNGHKYQIEKIKNTGTDYVIIVMSGDYVQRGTPAIMDKYARAKMALENGADLVIELPTLFATSSAQYFARGGVSILHSLGVVNELCFGCETDDISLLKQICETLCKEPALYKEALQANLKQGYSYPKARELALLSYYSHNVALLSKKGTTCNASLSNPSVMQAVSDILSSPNNILGIEYCLALSKLNSDITINPIRREGAGYLDTNILDGTYASASGIRNAIDCIVKSDHVPVDSFDQLADVLPPNVLTLLKESYGNNYPINVDDFSSILKYKLLLSENEGYEKYLDVGRELSDKILKNLDAFHSFSDFCMLLKSKEVTYSRISRSLLHILLNIESAQMQHQKDDNYQNLYARVLGFRKTAKPLLSEIKIHSQIPMISKLSNADKLLSLDQFALLKQDIWTAHIYESIVSQKFGKDFQNEYQKKLVIL